MENVGMFKEIVERADNITIVTDSSFNIRYISSAVVKAFDIKPAHLLGRNVFEFVNADRILQWKQCLLGQNLSLNEEISLTVAKGKKVYYDIHVSNLLDQNDVQGLALQLHDITDKKNKEHALVNSNLQLDQVIYKTTHDLKAPLMSALGLINLAEKASPDEKNEYIALIKKSLLKLNSFITEMNDFFRNEKLELQRDLINLESLLKEEIENLYPLSHNLPIDIDFKIEGDIEFYTDFIRVKTILTNILSNAIKYSDTKKIEPFIRIFVSLKEDFCEICIVDNGIGIDSVHQHKIFDLFFRGTNQVQGTGLGLFIVKDTIKRLKGTIEVSSTLGEGTTFVVKIPNQINQLIEVE